MLAYTNISHINNIIEVLKTYINEIAKKKLKYIRENVRLIFNDFADNAKKLLNIMRKLKVMLSKSRPTNFFKPRCNFKKSNYNFYIKNNAHYIAIFMVYITNIGVHQALPNNTKEYAAR